jgi:ABC transport system ATP-binding/permease protein
MPPPLLALQAATVRIGDRTLFAGLDVAVARGERVCLVGRNGSGKSTLLKALAGRIELDAGSRFLQPRTTVAYLPQEPETGEGSVREHVLQAVPGHEPPARARARAEAVLGRLGLDPDRPAATLSGGELRRASLARCLVVEPDVLLLDEPTNHLDLPTIAWLEQELQGFAGALVMVSHDRAFLTALSRQCWWLDRGVLRRLDDGFGRFERWSDEVLAAEEAEIARLDKRLLLEQDWLHRGVTARRRRNQGRLRRLEVMRAERRALARDTAGVRFQAGAAGQGSRMVIEAASIDKAWGDLPVVQGFSIRILKGDRIAIVGPNGAGKTTLLSLLTGELAPDRGTVRIADGLQIARFDQRRQQLDPARSPWDNLCPEGGDTVMVQGRPRHVVGYLRDFLFREDQARTPVHALSGGERNRLLLAKILASPSDLLVLDEPTNDLDMDTLDLLQEALADYRGTLLLVSHDRDFIDRLASAVVAYEGGGRWRELGGGLAEHLRAEAEAAQAAPAARAPAAKPAPRPRPASATRLQREIDKAARRVEVLQGERAALEALLADPLLYGRDPEAFGRAGARLEVLQVEIAAAEEHWLALELEREAQAG